MFNFRRTQNHLDTSLFDPEQDMDLVALIDEARTEQEIHAVERISRARMRARTKHLEAARRLEATDSARAHGYLRAASLMLRF